MWSHPDHVPSATDLDDPSTFIARASGEETPETGRDEMDDALDALYKEKGYDDEKATIAYCRIGERSSHTWFVLQELLGQTNVKNYDGSWVEYGSLVGVPIEK